jgi:hypothetical protein
MIMGGMDRGDMFCIVTILINKDEMQMNTDLFIIGGEVS